MAYPTDDGIKWGDDRVNHPRSNTTTPMTVEGLRPIRERITPCHTQWVPVMMNLATHLHP